MNLVKKEDGKVEYNGDDLTNLKTMDIVKKGIVLSPEGRRVFANLTVEENLILGAYTRKDKAGINEDIEKIYNLFPRLKEEGHGKNQVLYLEENSRCLPLEEP